MLVLPSPLAFCEPDQVHASQLGQFRSRELATGKILCQIEQADTGHSETQWQRLRLVVRGCDEQASDDPFEEVADLERVPI